ncbi:hypothetical protein JCM19000A_32700 [Silvimonas sp. JCM 19000]
MFKLDFTGTKLTQDKLARLAQTQLPFAAAKALTETAGKVRINDRSVMRQRFDRPTNWTLNSLFIKPATKARQEARVWIKDDAAKSTAPAQWMTAEVYGGERKRKRSEVALARIGYLRSGQFLLPAAGVPKDAFGNVRGSYMVKVLSALSAFGETGYTANRTRSRRSQSKARGFDIFFGKIDGTTGIWQRIKSAHGEGIKPLFFVSDSAPKYKVRIPFEAIAQNTSKAYLPGAFDRALKSAVLSMR